nr:hypothetical protein [uncultured Shinella sp.]
MERNRAGLAVEVLVNNSRALLDADEDGTLGAVIVRSDDDRRDGEVLGREHFG